MRTTRLLRRGRYRVLILTVKRGPRFRAPRRQRNAARLLRDLHPHVLRRNAATRAEGPDLAEVRKGLVHHAGVDGGGIAPDDDGTGSTGPDSLPGPGLHREKARVSAQFHHVPGDEVGGLPGGLERVLRVIAARRRDYLDVIISRVVDFLRARTNDALRRLGSPQEQGGHLR